METLNLNLRCSEPTELSKVLSIAGIFPNDPITYQGRSIKVDFDNLKYKDTPVMMAGQMVGVIPKLKIQTSGNRLRGTSGRFTDKAFASLIGQQINTGATLEPLEFDGDTVTTARLKSFTVEPSGRSSCASGPPPLSHGTTDDEAIAESLFKASGGGPSPVAPERDVPPRRVERQPDIVRQGQKADFDDDEQIAQMLFDASRGQAAEPDHDDPRRTEGAPAFVGSRFGNEAKNDFDDDDAIAEQLFQASGGGS